MRSLRPSEVLSDIPKTCVFNKVPNVIEVENAEIDPPRKTSVFASKTPAAAVEKDGAWDVWFPRPHVG